MTPHSNSLRALFIGIICASNSVLGSRTKLAVRDVSPSYFDTYQFKKLVPVLDFSQNCTEPFVWYHTLFPKVVPAPEKVKIKTCYDRPVEVAEWSFTTSETCEPGGIWRADLFWATNRDDNYFNALEHDTDRDRNKDIIKKVDLRVCIHEKSPPAASCWGEWINKPTWDYEWIVRVPDDSKYNPRPVRCIVPGGPQEGMRPVRRDQVRLQPRVERRRNQIPHQPPVRTHPHPERN